MIAAQNCANFGLSYSVGPDCLIFSRKTVSLYYAISEPSRLANRFAQFMQGRLVPLENCTIF